MYHHTIPNHLEVEETFLFGLTFRQIGVLGMGLTLCYSTFQRLLEAIPDPGMALLIGTIAALLLFVASAALALIRIAYRGLDQWSLVWFLYHLQPQIYRWQATTEERADPQEEEEHPLMALATIARGGQNGW